MKKILSLVFMLIIIAGMALTAAAEDYLYSASVAGEMSLHISPDENSYKITSVPACSKLKLIKKERTWGLVIFNNKCGWINLSFTRNTYNAAAEATGNSSSKTAEIVPRKNRVNLYSVPSQSEKLGSEVKYTVPQGLVLTITRETPSGWGLVSMNGNYAWVQMKDTKIYETEQAEAGQFSIYYVYALSEDGAGLSLWENAQGGNLCAVIPDCTKLTVREEKENFGYVSYDGMNGWIDLRHTALSLEDAQMNAGTSVNVEYEIKPKDGEKSVELLSVPSDNPGDGGVVVGDVKEAAVVYVMRTTLSGWSLINHNGVLGWLPPESAVPSEIVQKNAITVLEKQEEGYAAAGTKKGVKLFTEGDGKTAVTTLPECVKVKVIAHQNGYDYVYCDYASGWALSSEIADTYDKAVRVETTNKKSTYTTIGETVLMSAPTYSELCAAEQITAVAEGTYFEVVKQTVSEEEAWGLVKIDGKWGWIDLKYAESTRINSALLIAVLAAVAVVMIVVVAVLYVLKKKKTKKSKKELDKNENGERLLNDGSGS